MGSDSDWPKVKAAAAALDEFQVPYEVQVMSAHRTPEVVREYAVMAAARGVKVLVAAAGGAAHLAGVIASHTVLPVIGIPVPTDMHGGWTRCSRRCKCRATCPWPRSPWAAAARAMPGCWPCRSLATSDAALPGQVAGLQACLGGKSGRQGSGLAK